MFDLKTRIKEVLEQGHLMSLGTIDEGGVWVADVIYIFDNNFNIYWMSSPEVRHSLAILHESQVAGSITISNKSKEDNLGIQFEGKAQKIEGSRFDLATKHLLKRNHPPPEEDKDVLQGDSWYLLTPGIIQLTDEKNFGYEKQTLKLS